MKVVIFAGGRGTRLAEETGERPKPMVEIGGMPILWHIMKTYYHYGFSDFVILCGYKGDVIRKFFLQYYDLYAEALTVGKGWKETKAELGVLENWTVQMVDTGLDTNTGGRLLRAEDYIGDAPFLLTYGDGVADVNLNKLIETHNNSNSIVTMTAVMPRSRYGELTIGNNGYVTQFEEKPRHSSWINGGYFVVHPDAFNYLSSEDMPWEDVLHALAMDHKLSGYVHNGFWQSMDILKEKEYLNNLWNSGNAPWKVWQ